MFAATLTAITPLEVILFGKYNKTFRAIVIILFFKLGHFLFLTGAKLQKEGGGRDFWKELEW